MKRNKSWQKFEDWIVQNLKEIDPYARATKGSGNKGESHDIKTSCGLAIEAKERNMDSVYNEKWVQKIIEEVPLHSQDIPVLFTRNKEGKVRVHLDGEDFLRLYIEYFKLRKDNNVK